jgi:hypothetical protein
VRVDGKTNEIPVAQAPLPYLSLRSRMITAAALHTQPAFAQGVLDQGGDTLLSRQRQPTQAVRRHRRRRRRPRAGLPPTRHHHPPPGRARPVHLLAWIRGHWSVEARHNARYGTLGEDRSRPRHGHTPQIMPACRSLCITLLHRAVYTEIGARRRPFAYHPAQALALLLP